MYQITELSKGLKVELDGQPFVIVDFQFVKPGKGQAFTRTRLKNLITGSSLERTFKINETLAEADVHQSTMQYLYQDGEGFHFMNLESYEQIALQQDVVGDGKNWLVEEMKVDVLFYNDRPINIDLPYFVELEITYCEPGIRGNTATGTTKPATMSTGATVRVPLFIEQGEWIKIDTRTAEYVERVKK
ncbi:MAG: elongation factor P [Myxococcota bacterium]